jgi:hypothetical protein
MERFERSWNKPVRARPKEGWIKEDMEEVLEEEEAMVQRRMRLLTSPLAKLKEKADHNTLPVLKF